MMLIGIMTTEHLNKICCLSRKLQILVKKEYTLLCLAPQFYGINTMVFTQLLPASKTVHTK